jgi:GH24 family phage-related lysozyme (muramidase)
LIGGLRWAKNNAKDLLQDSDPNLVPGVMKKFGIDLPQKDIVGFHNSPHKFDNIDPSKQQEGLMGKGHYIFLNKTAADDYPGAYKYTQEVPDDIRNRVINFGDGKDSLLVKSAFKNISEKTGIKFSDDFRPGSYFELIDEVGHDKAHELLRAEGVIGNMTDIGTTSKPEAVMMYNPDDVQLLSRNGESLIQGQTKETDPMIVQHNLSETGVEIADEIGGIPMPSMAVSKVDSPLTSFGDITLVGDKTLATPDRRNFVYSSDTYTGSQPSRFMAFTDVEKVADSIMNRADIKHFGDNYMFDLSSDYIDKEEIYKKLARIDAMAAKGYKTTDYDRYADMEKAFFKENPDESRWYFHTDYEVTPESLGEVEAVFTSSSGKNQPYTKENVLKQMEKNKAWKPATESGTLGSPTGRKRAVTAKKFTNIEQVKAAREKIIPEEQFQEIAQSVQDKEFRVSEAITKLDEVDKRTSGQWGFGHDLSHELMETVLSGKSIDSYGFSEETNKQLLELINPLKDMMKDMPTKYFEIKPRDIKTLSDFKGAIVPHYAKEARKLLKKAGIKKIYTYGTEEERKELFKKFPELMFAKVAIPAGALTLQDSDANELSDFIKGYEKYKGAGYYATKSEEKEGLVTAGYGSTRRVKHGEKVTKEQAEKWLKEDIKKANTTVDRLVKIEINNNQRNALVSLVYNVGEGNFKKSKALKALNSGDIETFLKEAFDPKIGFVKAKKGGRILKGLVNRRSAEKELFIKGTK